MSRPGGVSINLHAHVPETWDQVALERLVGNRTGHINELSFKLSPREHEGTVVARIAGTAIGDDESTHDFNAMGKGPTRNAALKSVLGEFAERYAGHVFPRPADTVQQSYHDLESSGRGTVPFESLSLYDANAGPETPYERLTKDDALSWVMGKNLETDERVPVPEALICGGDGPYFYGSSNGWACHQTTERALIGSFYELIERDAILRTWFCGVSPTELSLDLDAIAPDIDTATASEADVHLVELPSRTSVTVVGVLFVGDGDSVPKFLLTAGANLDFRTAVRDALLEMSQGLQQYKARLGFDDTDIRAELGGPEPMQLGENVKYYMLPENFDQLSSLFEGQKRRVSDPEVVEFETPRKELAAICRSLTSAGMQPIAVDMTPRDLRMAGMTVTAGFVPELVPLCRPGMPPDNHPEFDGMELREAYHPLG